MGAHEGSHIQKIRQTNTAETPLVILIKKTPRNQKEKEKKVKICALIVPFRAHPQIPTYKKFWRCCGTLQKLLYLERKARFRMIKHALHLQHIDTSIEYLSVFNL